MWSAFNMQEDIFAIMQSSNLYMFGLHNPVRWTDSTGLDIRLDGTEEEIATILHYLQQLTNHGLRVTDGLLEIYHLAHYAMPELRNGTWLGHGNALIERMIASPHTTRISITNGRSIHVGDSDTMFHNVGRGGSGGRIFFNPNTDYYTYIFDAYGIATLRKVPTFIVLGHEMIHADRAMRGVSIRSSVTSEIQVPVYRAQFNPMRLVSDVRYATHTVPREELAAIGIGHSHRIECITENMLRTEHGLRPRASWGGRRR